MSVKPTVEFYYDISCPFAYIASTRIEALAARTNAQLKWRPVLLGAIYRATSAPQGAAGSASDVFNSTKKAVTSRAFMRTLQRFKIPYNEPPQHPIKTTAPLRLLYHVDESDRPKLTHSLFRAYWVEGKDVTDNSVLADIAHRAGITNIAEAIKTGDFEGEDGRSALECATDLAIQRGTPGVPGFYISQARWVDKAGEQREGRLYWGQDRMHFVEAVLESLNASGNGTGWSSLLRPLMSLFPRCALGEGINQNEEVKLQFWYDFSSPWAFLGWTQLDRLKRQFGERLHFEMKPFLLGILFREIGAPNEPGSAVSKQRANYNAEDHRDWVAWWNAVNAQEGSPDKNIDFHWADKFPIRTPTLLRAVLVEPKLIDVLYRACWERNLDMSSDDVLKSVIAEAGYDADDVLKRANGAECKAELRSRTKEAKDNGLCGVPTYRVFRRKVGEGEDAWKVCGDLVWGQDEFPVVQDLIAGWEGEGPANGEEGRRKDRANKL